MKIKIYLTIALSVGLILLGVFFLCVDELFIYRFLCSLLSIYIGAAMLQFGIDMLKGE